MEVPFFSWAAHLFCGEFVKGRENIQRGVHRARKGGLALGLVVLLVSGFARADDAPFEPNNHWIPFSHYKDTGGVEDEAETVTPLPKGGAEVLSAPTQQVPVAPSSSAASTAPVIAAPKRPIDLPLMPGMNKGFDVRVNSTDDDYVPSATTAVNKSPAAQIHLPDKKWVDPSVAAKPHNTDDSETEAPLNVRMSFLPNQRITPIPSPEHPSALELGREQLKKGTVKKETPPKAEKSQPTPEDAAACAAIEAYKKQQLDAIQGDRQTLLALQEAIKSLGLQKQLGFIAGSGGALSTPAPQLPASIEIPASTPTK